MPQEKPNDETNKEHSQTEGQPHKAKAEAADNTQGENMHAAQDADVRAYGEPTDGSGGGGNQDQTSTVP